MPPQHLQRACNFVTDRTEHQADLTEPGPYASIRRFQWHPLNPKVTILDFSHMGTCELVRDVPMEHARYLWSKLIKQGWTRKV